MKPKIQLVGGCASSLINEVASGKVPESGNDSCKAETSTGGVAERLLEAFLGTIINTVDASAGIVRVLSPGGLILRTIGCAGRASEACQAECEVDAACGVCGKSVSDKLVVASDTDYCRERFGKDFFGEACKFVLAVPLGVNGTQSEPAGVLTLFFENEQNITEDIRRSLDAYSALIHVALKNVWQSQDDHQVDLLAERQSIANEIHDSLAQTLYFAKIRSSLLLDAMKTENELLAYKCAQDIDEALETSQKTVRELVTHFRCQMDPRGLLFALQKLVNDFVARTGIVLEYQNAVEEFVLPLEFELQVFLIIREALVNIATHSGATVSRLSVVRTGNQFQFVIEDNGGGVSIERPPEGHYGLAIMNERALRIGGVVEVVNLQGQGTRVRLNFSVPGA